MNIGRYIWRARRWVAGWVAWRALRAAGRAVGWAAWRCFRRPCYAKNLGGSGELERMPYNSDTWFWKFLKHHWRGWVGENLRLLVVLCFWVNAGAAAVLVAVKFFWLPGCPTILEFYSQMWIIIQEARGR